MSVIKNLWTAEETQSRINTAISGVSGSTSTSIAALETKVTTNTTNIATNATGITQAKTAASNAQNKADSAYSLAEGRARALYYATNAAANTAITALSSSSLKVGDNIYIGTTSVPDWYVAEVLSTKASETLPTSGSSFADNYSIGYFKLAQLETEKVDLSAYETSATAGGKYFLISNFTAAKIVSALGTSSVNRATADADGNNIASTYALKTSVPTSATFGSNTLTFKNSSGTTLFTVSLSSLIISDATTSTKGKVLFATNSYYATGGKTNDTMAITAAYANSIVTSYGYATNTALSAVSQTVDTNASNIATNTNSISAINAKAVNIAVSDGSTVGGVITLTFTE